MKLDNSQYKCDVCGSRCDCKTDGVPDIYLSRAWTNLEYHFCSYPCFHKFISNKVSDSHAEFVHGTQIQEEDIPYTVYNSFLKDYGQWAMKLIYLALTEGEVI